jgi:GNAT superfamily N-acetyltransferase
MICRAKSVDLPDIVEAVMPLYRESNHPFDANREVWVRAWSGMIEGGTGVIYFGKTDDGRIMGAIGGAFFPSLNTGLLQASELVWYVLPEFRGHALGWALYRLFEMESKRRNVYFMTMSHLADNDSVDTLREFYKREGYRKMETVYIKELK